MSYGKSFYEKKIKYLDYFEGQMRFGGGGFAKLEVREGKLRVDMTVTGLHATDTFSRDVVLCGKGRERVAGRINLTKGRGQYRQQWQDLEDIGGTGISYGELQGIRIPLGAGREVSCRWQAGGDTEERRYEGSEVDEARYGGSEVGEERYDGSEEREQRPGGKETEKKLAARELSERELPERELSEKERAAADRWKIEEDTETGTISRESEIKAMEGGRREMAGASDRSEIHYSRGRYAAEEETKRQANGAYGMDSGRPGGYMAEEGRKNQVKAAYKTEELRPGGYAAEDGIRVQENGRYGMDRQEDMRNRTQKETDYINEDRQGAEGGSGYGSRRDAESREGYSGRKTLESSGDRKRGEKPIGKQMKPMEDKWPQLWAIYPHIRPFQDEREYLSIGPADFVLFPAASYKAVNNSFLLHGYYNYKHLILARVEKRGDVFYYIGVPGNFYEREKQVAIMFGFESFECAEEPAQAGDFGYYMMRTEL